MKLEPVYKILSNNPQGDVVVETKRIDIEATLLKIIDHINKMDQYF